MKLYMLVYVVEGEQAVMFGSDLYTMLKSKMDIECGLGGYAELYKRMEAEDGMEYVLFEA